MKWLILIIFLSISGIIVSQSQTAPGDMIYVRSSSAQVGVLLDDFPDSLVNEYVSRLKNLTDDFWIKRAKRQMLHAQYKLIFLNAYDKAKKSMILPGREAWSIKFTSEPKIVTVDNHKLLVRDYQFETYLIGLAGSAAKADAIFLTIGGESSYEYYFPIDPQLIMQRTRYDCMNEADFPKHSVDPEFTDSFYDDTCGPEVFTEPRTACTTDVVSCHCTESVSTSCANSIAKNVGGVKVTLFFKMVAWDETIAKNYEALNKYKYNPNASGADLKGVIEGLERYFIVYRYFDCAARCEKSECLENKCGWRRLIIFSTIDVNIGKTPLDIGTVVYSANTNEFDEDKYNYLFAYDNCHKHPHFEGYAAYSYGSLVGKKQGFCLQDVIRMINHRNTPISSNYDKCNIQGISNGFADNYQGGIPCQWMDVTTVKQIYKLILQTS